MYEKSTYFSGKAYDIIFYQTVKLVVTFNYIVAS